MTRTDLIIIGSGPGGYRAAQYAAKHGLEVIIFEDRRAGGTCLNEGCIPTKCLVHDSLKGTAFADAMTRKEQVSDQLRQGVEALMAQPHITMVKTHAALAGDHKVVADGETYEADNIIIATGSQAKLPPIADIDRPEVMTSTELLSIDHLPKRLAVIGAGVIGMEFASIFHRMGVEVEVYEFLKECLPMMDKDLAKRLRKKMEKDGIKFNMGYSVSSIADLQADAVLVATGRKPTIERLNLEEAGVVCSRGGIEVDDNMQTSVEGIYAIGDVNGRAMLAHAATFQGFRAVNHILHRSDQIRLDIMPAAVFTSPELASVGVTDDACKKNGVACKTYKGMYRSNGKALAEEATEGLAKIVTDEEGRVIGCHILGAHAADMVQEMAALMNKDIRLAELADIVHIHPTLGEILQDIAVNA
ncbi:MAG: NAD(P)/FAD-dependent oxidoreductase [Bacteroidales bacterium]|nr:NAD(P)/FAD-dependent oxidoreductase [Bacteroidales bacterium]